MWFARMRNFRRSGGQHSQDVRRPRRRNGGGWTTCQPNLEELECRALPSATLHMAVMGDSLSAPYESYRAAYGDQSWVEQLQALRSNKVDIHNVAFSGATSSSLFQSQLDSDGILHGPQVSAVVDLVAHHAIKDVVVMIGANDVFADLPLFNPGNPSSAGVFVNTFVSTVVSNIEAALQTVAHAGHVDLVVSTIPDVTVTPYFQANIAALTPLVETAITMANDQIKTFAATHEIPVVDLYGLTRLTTQTITVGGVRLVPRRCRSVVRVAWLRGPDCDAGTRPRLILDACWGKMVSLQFPARAELKRDHIPVTISAVSPARDPTCFNEMASLFRSCRPPETSRRPGCSVGRDLGIEGRGRAGGLVGIFAAGICWPSCCRKRASKTRRLTESATVSSAWRSRFFP
jgi:lysophospholipase L1-like esterase